MILEYWKARVACSKYALKEIKYIFILSIILNSVTTGFVYSSINYLQEVSLYYGNLVDGVECSFSKRPFCFCDKLLSSKAFQRCIAEDSGIEEEFFVPYAITSKKRLLSCIDKYSTQGYSLSFKAVKKPVKGIAITVKYNPKKVKFEHNVTQALDPHSIFFKFYNKGAVEKVKEGHAQIRWLAMGKHQPRIVFDCSNIQSDTRYYKNEIYLSNKLKKELISKGMEVFYTNHTSRVVGDDIKVGIANMLYQADIVLSLSVDNTSNYFTIVFSNNLKLKEQKALTKKLAKKLEKEIVDVYKDSCKCKCVNISYDSLLSNTEMPSCRVIIPYSLILSRKNNSKKIVYLLKRAIQNYFKED